MTSRGPRKSAGAVQVGLERHPSSRISRSFARLKTWKPPLSVRIGPSHPMNRCSPPRSRMSPLPGRRLRW